MSTPKKPQYKGNDPEASPKPSLGPNLGNEDVAEFWATLFESGAYSDLKIVCKDREFLVHKVVVCARSPVIAAALQGDFIEATTNTFKLDDFNPQAVQETLYWMYTAKYRETRQDASKPINAYLTDLTNIRELADYLALPELECIALGTIYIGLRTRWDIECFIHLARRLLVPSTLRVSRIVLAALTAKNQTAIIEDARLFSLELDQDFIRCYFLDAPVLNAAASQYSYAKVFQVLFARVQEG